MVNLLASLLASKGLILVNTVVNLLSSVSSDGGVLALGSAVEASVDVEVGVSVVGMAAGSLKDTTGT